MSVSEEFIVLVLLWREKRLGREKKPKPKKNDFKTLCAKNESVRIKPFLFFLRVCELYIF